MFLPEFREMVRALMRKPDGRVIPLEVAALGLVGEVNECLQDTLVLSESLLELGDVAWYACALQELILGLRLDTYPSGTEDFPLQCAAQAAELVKKHVWHDKTPDPKLLGSLISGAVWGCCGVVDSYEFNTETLEAAQRATMAKLAKRWPNGFGVQP